ncbi:MAG TPA: ion channel [Roseiarcus sp.]|nr:ion channel [Roseiarcus sp.]
MTAPDDNASTESAGRRRPRRPRPFIRDVAGRRIIAEGLERNFWTDLYFNAMTVSWPAFIAALAGAFVALNFAFALVYLLGTEPIANARDGNLADYFFFSVETTSTTGYGDMHPQTLYGHIVATVENFVGVLLLATMTGLMFARFSRPRARIIFAKYPVVTSHNGAPTLMFRLANARRNFISEATAKVWSIGATVSEEGRRMVGFERMRLLKSENPTFALSWTLFHPIDENSPLFGMDKETLVSSRINFAVIIVGFDETSGQTLHARDVFAAQDVRWGHEYVDIIWVDDQGLRHIDYSKIDATSLAAPFAAGADDAPLPGPAMDAAEVGNAAEEQRR